MKIIIHFLNSIKKLLNFLKEHSFPNYKIIYPAKSYLSIYRLYEQEEEKKCYEHFKKYFKSSLFLKGWKIREYAIQKAIDNDFDKKNFYIEFGVYVGTTINFFSEKLNSKIYGFDSFLGLKEDWKGHNIEKGRFNLQGKVPKLNKYVDLQIGLVQQTLPSFLNEKKPIINFVHMDMDTYETSKFVLLNIKPYLKKNSVILFDELYNFPGWDVGEYRALTEVFDESEYTFLAFRQDGTQAVIEIN
jgi:hypothetical protein